MNRPPPTAHYLSNLVSQIPLIWFLALLLSGCLAYLDTPYYRPSAPEGRLSRALQPTTESVIIFNRQGVMISLSTAPDSNNRLVAALCFEVPDNATAQLQGRHLTLSLESGNRQGLRPDQIRGFLF